MRVREKERIAGLTNQLLKLILFYFFFLSFSITLCLCQEEKKRKNITGGVALLQVAQQSFVHIFYSFVKRVNQTQVGTA